MKLSKVTVDILKNMSDINQRIIINPGHDVRSMNVMKTMFVRAIVPDEFPKWFAIYDMPEFLNVYGIFGDPDLEFHEDHVIFRDTELGDEIEYFYSSPSVIISPGDKNITLPSWEKRFKLTQAALSRIDKISSTGKLKDIKVGDKKMMIFNRNGVGLRAYINLDIECSGKGKPSDNLFKIDNLKLLPLDYEVAINEKGLAHFKSTNDVYNIEYFITLSHPDDK